MQPLVSGLARVVGPPAEIDRLTAGHATAARI